MITVRTIGAAEVVIGKRRITPRTEVMFAVAVYLAARAGERVPRDELVRTFWAGASECNGRHNLRQMLYRLRRAGFCVSDDGHSLSADPSAIEADFHQQSPSAECAHDKPGPRGSAGEFLSGWKRIYSEPFRDWLDGMRSRVSSQQRAGAMEALAGARQSGQWHEMARWAELVLHTDPLNEEATLAKAESIAMLGSKARALSVLDDYIADLGHHASHLGLPASVLRRRISERDFEWGARGLRDGQLVGREELVRRLTTQLSLAATGTPQAIILLGPAGIGKTRLASELRAIAGLQGFRSVSLRLEPGHSRRPFAAVVALASALRDLPGAAGSAPAALAITKRLTSSQDVALPPDSAAGGNLAVAQIAWAVNDMLTAIASERKLLLTLDDVHHLDECSGEVLSALSLPVESQRMVILCTSRGMPTSLRAADSFVRITVPPLTDVASAELALSCAQSASRTLTDNALTTITSAAGGNPLFIREFCTHPETLSQQRQPPTTVVDVISRRLSALAPNHVRLLQIVTLLGSHATIARLRTVLQSPPLVLAEALDGLEQEGILSLTAERTLLLHDCWRHCVDSGISPTARAALSFECATALTTEATQIDKVDALWLAADLFEASGDRDRARSLFLSVGDRLLRCGIAHQATEAYSRCLAASTQRGDALLAFERVARAQSLAGDFTNAIASARAGLLQAGPEVRSFKSCKAQLLATLADAVWREELDHKEVLDQLTQLIEDDEVEDSVRQYACLAGMRLVYTDVASELAGRFVGVVLAANARSGPSPYGELARLIHESESGSSSDVRKIVLELDDLPFADHPPTLRAKALRYQATALRHIGDSDRAVTFAIRARDYAVAAGLPDEAETCALFLAFLYLDQGQTADARGWLQLSRQWSRADSSSFQRRQSWHVEARLLAQECRFSECLTFCLGALDSIRGDRMTRRRVTEAVIVSSAAAECGMTDLAREMLAMSLPVLESDAPCAPLDFVTEMSARTLRSLGDTSLAERVVSSYLARRRLRFPRPIPAGFYELNRAEAAHTRPSIA